MSDFILNSAQLQYCKCDKVSFKRGETYTKYLDLMKNKKSTINPINEDDKYFQYAATVALNDEEIKRNPQRISNIKPFVNITGF